MKKWITMLFAVLALTIATPVMAASVYVETQNSFVAPARGAEFTGPQTVTIQIQAGDLVEGRDTYCEVIGYSGPRGGLKVLEQTFPVTEKGQIITTTLDAPEYGTYRIFTSTLFYVNGFKNYANERNMYIYNGSKMNAGDSVSFSIVEKKENSSGDAGIGSGDAGSGTGTGSGATGSDKATGSEIAAEGSSAKQAVKFTAKNKTFKAKVKIKKYAVTLKNKKGKAVKKAKVTLKVGGKTYTAKTNSKGKAVFKINKLTKKGTYKATLKFAGNKTYKAVSKKVKITVKK